MQYNIENTIHEVEDFDNKTSQSTIEDYSKLLIEYNANYQQSDYFWLIGTSPLVQGWILHVSVIAPQICKLLHILLPILIAQKVPFKLPQDKDTARHILDGNLGYEQIGQILSIYPENAVQALELARQLVLLTQPFRGPVIPIAIHLGGTIYTRYGGINPILRQGNNGEIEKYIYDGSGELIKDNSSISFFLPAGTTWPFSEFSTPTQIQNKKNLRQIYRPLTTLKPDARGNVIKALYVKGLFRLGTCVIKIGKKNMLADDMGRDIRDRLLWQKYLHEQLEDTVRVPKIFDFFEEEGDTHLVMEFIKGQSLHDSLIEINSNQICWFQITKEGQIKILDWLLKIITIIDQIHKKGFVHRDIAPGNFIINREEIILIDTELMYDLKNNKKEKPYELGTPGFMSPEQEAISTPTIKEDIYGLGALMINMFTCLSASRFDAKNPVALYESLIFFTRDPIISTLITTCLDKIPSNRPSIYHIQKNIEEIKNKFTKNNNTPNDDKDNFTINWQPELIKKTIKEALVGLSQQSMPIIDGVWFSKTIKNNNYNGTEQKEHAPYAGINTGMTGVLYLLARAKKMGYDLEVNKLPYKQSWKYIHQEYLKKLDSLQPGLYNGLAGIALTLAEGIEADLVEDSDLTKDYIHHCFAKPTEQLNISDGVAGQALVLLQCKSYLKKELYENSLDNCIQQLLNHQGKNGCWLTKSSKSRKQFNMPLSWGYGISGIISLLLIYNSRHENKQVLRALNMGLSYLRKHTHDLKGLFIPSIYKKILDGRTEIGDERTSILLCFIHAYEILKEPYYMQVAEWALYHFPDFVVNNNFCLDGGLSMLGEVYIEAWRVFKNEEWLRRAQQIATVFLRTTYRNSNDSCYWLTDESRKPAADLFTGNSGIIHFLLRCTNPNSLKHVLLK